MAQEALNHREKIEEDEEDRAASMEEEDESEDEVEGEKQGSLAKAAITGRSVTLQMLISEKIIEPGSALLSLKYLGRRFIADLLPDGIIQMPGTKETFTSPSAWAIHCKKQVNPHKKSGCGWASVLYKERKLDIWKAAWFRKHRTSSPIRNYPEPSFSQSPRSPWSSREDTNDLRLETNGKLTVSELAGELQMEDSKSSTIPHPAHTSIPNQNGKTEEERIHDEKVGNGFQEEALNLSLKTSKLPQRKESQTHFELDFTERNNNYSEKKCIKHAALKSRSQSIDPLILVECESFKELDKVQPFTVSIASNALLLMDFHCHLTSREVVGYLGGKWNQNTQHLTIVGSYPCKCREADSKKAAIVEEEIRHLMNAAGLILVGWYHSHPFSQANPSVKDIDCQMSYQLCMKGSGSNYFPCVGVIIAPYNRQRIKKESACRMYMVMPPLDEQPSDYGIPMIVKFSLQKNLSVTEELLSEMKAVTDFYFGTPDWLKFRQSWQPTITYLDKLKGSLATKLPEDQMENGTFLEFVQHLILSK
ncbi:MPN domain-containing protein-like isoform X2 [Ostrea edulis]|uniref:MPN domain-containing protein-like isoform X2 n=1 Tax=Ostrea edulis TaxID=37623 RepID=UPI00209463B8|nr:MPN domain-containing protein-like isoform X2 [Ostrea edulis]